MPLPLSTDRSEECARGKRQRKAAVTTSVERAPSVAGEMARAVSVRAKRAKSLPPPSSRSPSPKLMSLLPSKSAHSDTQLHVLPPNGPQSTTSKCNSAWISDHPPDLRRADVEGRRDVYAFTDETIPCPTSQLRKSTAVHVAASVGVGPRLAGSSLCSAFSCYAGVDCPREH